MSTNTNLRTYFKDPAVFSTIFLIASGLLGILLFSASQHGGKFLFKYLGISTAITLASLLCGGFVGFIFGIPKTLQQEEGDKDGQRRFGPNTNLEQISDWLTKILVGVGLTQVYELPTLISFIADKVGAAFGDTPEGRVFAVAIIIYFVVGGFMLGFIVTRLYLPRAFEYAEAITRLKDELKEEVVQESIKIADYDAEAISMANLILDPDRQISSFKENEFKKLNEAIQKASRRAKVDIFEKARLIRSSNWLFNKSWMERTIPVFEALVETDQKRVYHNYRGQLGFAYKDKEDPTKEDFLNAKYCLEEAIEIRGSSGDGFLFYEFNRAIVNILLDPNFQKRIPSDGRSRDIILADLNKVKTTHYYDKVTQDKEAFTTTPINEWCEINGLPAFIELEKEYGL